MALLVRGLGVNLVDGYDVVPPLLVSVFVSVGVLLAGFGGIAGSFGKKVPLWLQALLLVFYVAPYFGGAILALNRLLDVSDAQVAEVVVQSTRMVEDHKYGDVHYATVSSWGPHEVANEVQVPRSWFEVLQPGSSLCIHVYPGAFNIQWWSLAARCE